MGLGRRIADLSIRSKIMIAFFSIIAMMLGTSGLIYQKVSFVQKASVWRAHLEAVIINMKDAMTALVEQESALRASLLNSTPDLLSRFKQGGTEFTAAFNANKSLTADNAAQQARLGELSRLVEAWHQEVANAGDGSKQMEAVRAKTAEFLNT